MAAVAFFEIYAATIYPLRFSAPRANMSRSRFQEADAVGDLPIERTNPRQARRQLTDLLHQHLSERLARPPA